jgi:ABC-2 type transport system permease protein
MNKIRLIIWREFITRVRKPSFLIMTILGPVLIVGGILITVFLATQEKGPQNIYVYDQAHLFTGKLTPNEELGISYYYSYENLEDSAFKESPYTILVYLNEKILTNDQAQVFYKDLPSQKVQNYVSNDIEQVLRKAKLAKDGVDVNKYDAYSKALKFELYNINKGGKKSYEQVKAGLGFAFGYLIFIFIFLYGVQVMRGVMEEKQSRVVEVLISSVRPFQLMMGKIVGIAMVGLTQFLLWVIITGVLGVIGIGLAKDKFAQAAADRGPGQITVQLQQEMGVDEQSTDATEQAEKAKMFVEIWEQLPLTEIVLLFIFYFLGGYLLFSSLFAAIGAAVDSETDTQQFMFPITVPMIIAIFIAQTAVYNPDGPAVFWSSIIPFTSPVVMMIRIATGNAFEHPVHLVLSMVLLVVTFLFTTWLAGRIYRTGILMYGKKITWKELGKWLFYRG